MVVTIGDAGVELVEMVCRTGATSNWKLAMAGVVVTDGKGFIGFRRYIITIMVFGYWDS